MGSLKGANSVHFHLHIFILDFTRVALHDSKFKIIPICYTL